MNVIELWQTVEGWLLQEQPVILCVVVASTKGSPGNPGQFMALSISRAGALSVIGTIGGGIMEYRLLEELSQALREQKTVCTARTLHHSNRSGIEQSGLLCSGSQSIICLSLLPGDSCILQQLLAAYRQRTGGILRLSSESGLELVPGNNAQRFTFFATNDGWHFEESLMLRESLYIAGGGHVGIALARQAELLGLEPTLFDERPAPEQYADGEKRQKRITVPFEQMPRYVPETPTSYIVIVTAAMSSDVRVLQALSGKSYGYIGLMGSAAKLGRIFREARRSGCSQEWLRKIYAPAGLAINSDTPQEIAVSICAEIIGIKNGHTPQRYNKNKMLKPFSRLE